jgi:2-oxo-4-hydroxy-4-carboxy--5-ureidoimidazoline (OHCU) decarboxylase
LARRIIEGKVDPSELDRLPRDDFIDRMAPLFEGAPRFLSRLAGARPFGDDDALFARARAIAHAMPEADKLELIDAHPRLGAPPGSVSAHSYVEQGYDREAADTHAESVRRRVVAELARLNATYEARFGFRYCVFVAGRSREALLPAIRDALDSDRETEIERALDAVVDIARDRYRKLSPDGAR